jgi:SMC interacting uncharacterized protein involved in chromosome segregation
MATAAKLAGKGRIMTSKAKPQNQPTATERLQNLLTEIERVESNREALEAQTKELEGEYVDLVARVGNYSEGKANQALQKLQTAEDGLVLLENRQIALQKRVPAFELEVAKEELAGEIAAFPGKVAAQEKTRKAWEELAGKIREKMPPIVQAYKRTKRALQETTDKIRYLEYTTNSAKTELPRASYINPKSSQELEKLICSNDPTAGSLFAVSTWKQKLDELQTVEQRERAVEAIENEGGNSR